MIKNSGFLFVKSGRIVVLFKSIKRILKLYNKNIIKKLFVIKITWIV